ncbi:hypothetical protein BS50DRAFT_614690 [Corynespora cassiicola Philippines]|uniref:Uncharacterized protein n=1 Tax=Corynespora cassiicola Philippines TaxID=1448308 RepID=A0A2T2N111_CORCC|nr:hypothetical protein BS50DRAFT_614690 [Corynespora cassiicola Philippines]
MPRQLRREDYTVGWVCALPVELAAAKAMLDEKHDNFRRDVSSNDENVYSVGSIAGHNVVIVCLPAGHIGNNPAATVATQMRAAFRGVRFGLMVGIGGGVPSAEADIRLGDVVVSKPYQTFGGVVQYDMGKSTPNRFERTGSLNSPPQILLSARGRTGPDVLARSQRESGEVVAHYGTIASGNQVMRNAAERDRVSAELGGVLCFEMEAAGLTNSFPCLVVRGICDYADSHKNKRWQAYAAGTAAAWAKELLSVIPAADVMSTRRAEEAMNGSSKRSLEPLAYDRAPKRRNIGTPNSTEDNAAEEQTTILPTHHRPRDRTSLNDEQRHWLLESLTFEQIDARQMTIKTAHVRTCKWLLKSPQYLDWFDATKVEEHHGFLWIKGKAGAGKSTLMKFAMINARRKMKDCVKLAFFFNARGEDIEKSTIRAYRSLLLQLLKQIPALQTVFDSLNLLTSNFSTDYHWNIESLKMLLEQAIRALGESSVVCFIDALDECEEEQVRDMVQFFERIGDLTVTDGTRFQVCFSSRHYPHITIRRGLELVLEGQEGHTQDIANYVETELKIGKGKTAQQVRVELQEKASGIFMWVVLVVGILNKESDRGQVHTLRRKLQEIPGDLHELFRDILTRDSHNRDGLVLCIQWVLFAKQPLSPEQLYHAILSGTDPDAVSEWDSEEVTKDVIKRFILDSSKGLAEATMSKEQRVQFIHESNGLSKIWPEFGSNFQGQSHERLKLCCLSYISIDVASPLEIPDRLPKASSQEAATLRKVAAQKFPFLEYAVHNVLYHADVAEGGGISQADFLSGFPLPRWVGLDNLFEKHEVRRHTERVGFLYMLAELNMASLLKTHPSILSCLEVEDERYGCALFAAIATGSEEAVQACMEGLEASRSTESRSYDLSRLELQSGHATRGARRDFNYSKKRGSGREAAVKLLVSIEEVDVNSKDKQGIMPLLIAAEKGHDVVARLLIEGGADVNAQGGIYGNALYAASWRGHKDTVELLVKAGADVNAQGADVKAQGGFYGNALYAASERGHKDIVELLVEAGADVNAQGGKYSNALYAASERGHKDIVELLRKAGATLLSQNSAFFAGP